MRFIPWLLFGVTALGLVGYIGYTYGGKKLETMPIDTSGDQSQTVALNPTSAPSNQLVSPTQVAWTKYSGNRYSVMYPGQVEFQIQGDTAVLTQWGPTQKQGTEFYDGISLSFKSASLDGKTIKEQADKRAAEMGGVFETSPVSETKVGSFSGYKFNVKGYAEADYYYLDLGTNTYLELVNGTKDPTNVGFPSLVEQILATLAS